MAQGLINNGVSVTKTFSPNEYELLADYTVSGSAMTSITFGTSQAPLRINADEEIVLVGTIINGTASNATLSIYANGNTTSTNYYLQHLAANGTSISSARVNSSASSSVKANGGSYINVPFKLTNSGFIEYQNNSTTAYGLSTIYIENGYTTSTFTLSQINSLTITSSVASAIGIGSRFQLYKVKGQVQQTWATT